MRQFQRAITIVFVSMIALTTNNVAQSTQLAPDIKQNAERIAGTILVNGRAMDYLGELTDKHGARLTASAGYNRAAEWAAEQFRAAGIKNVRLEPFTIENAWERGYGKARMIAPMERHLYIESLGWAPSTPAGGVKGEVLFLDTLDAEKIKALSEKIKGKIVFLDTQKIFAEGFAAFAKLITAQQSFKEAGAIALMMPDGAANNVLNAFSLDWGTRIAPLPVAQIGGEDTKLITRLLEKNPVTIEFEYTNKITKGPITVNNVVAEITGRERPDEWIIVGGHLDAWDFGTGAQDNGSGCAMVMEAARAIASLGQAPRRSIRFALWGGEEQGLLGSEAYVKAHKNELTRCVAVVNTDNGAGHPKGWKVQSRQDVADALKPISKALLTGLSAQGVSLETSFDTDHGHFMLAGIPAFDLWVDMEPYGKIHHKPSDTMDKVDAHNLASGSAIVAITAYVLGERAEVIAPHLKHDAVGEILKKNNLDGFLKAVGVWQ